MVDQLWKEVDEVITKPEQDWPLSIIDIVLTFACSPDMMQKNIL